MLNTSIKMGINYKTSENPLALLMLGTIDLNKETLSKAINTDNHTNVIMIQLAAGKILSTFTLFFTEKYFSTQSTSRFFSFFYTGKNEKTQL